MIRYTLKCDKNHVFDSWFPSAEGFERLRAGNLASCPICGSTNVEKSLMSPRVHAGRDRAEPPIHGAIEEAETTETKIPSAPPGPSNQQVSLQGPDTPLARAIERLRAEVEATSDYVGKEFVREARAIHDGDAPERAIHGEARIDEARALAEEGIPVLPLPFSNRTKSN